MTDNEIIKAWDILCKFDFFGGQRAGRELWNEKPTDIQDKDIEAFSRDVAFLKDFINRQKAEIERLEAEYEKVYEQAEANILGNMADGGTSCHWCIDKHRANAIKEFAYKLKQIPHSVVYKWQIDDVAKEMEGDAG